jgi:mannose-6-phosphate isomerase-like protein (cupin superfamily)
MRMALIVASCLVLTGLPAAAGAQQPAPPQGRQGGPAQGRGGARPSLTVFVTTLDGSPLGGVWVRATGPVTREGATEDDGTVVFRNMTAGTYRLRFEHDEFVTFEREIAVSGRAAKATASLTPAPPPPEPPKTEPAPAPAPAPPAGPPAKPTTLSIIDYIERNYIKNAPSVQSVVGCMPTATASVLQLRDPLAEHTHDDGDEMLYVVAGNGSHRMGGSESPLSAGVFVVVPRGTPHSIQRRGSNPLMLMTILAGPPCSGS